MTKNNDILNELKEISSFLAEIPKENIQTVPADYFDNLEERLCINTLLHQNDTREYFNQEKPGVPSGYFENLSDFILSKIKEASIPDMEESFPFLDSLKNENVFKVPAGYFENLSDQIIDRTQVKEEAKVISIGVKWWKYAAAAAIAGIMLISGLFIFNSGSNQVSQYLAASQQYQTSSQIEDGIASLMDDDIIKYLETHGNITDNEVLLEYIDTDALPTELDYLIDDNTLNNYLNKINIDQK